MRISYEEYKAIIWTYLANSWTDLAERISGHREGSQEAVQAYSEAERCKAEAARWRTSPASGSSLSWGDEDKKFWDYESKKRFFK